MGISDMLSRPEFYAQDVWGTRFSSTHRGMDIERAAGRPVPHLFPGSRVVRRGSNSELGEFAVDDRGAAYQGRGRYIGYGHTVDGGGNELGHVAGYGEDHGSKWSGPHTHVTVSDSPYGIDTPSLPTYDPLPFIIEAITSASFESGADFPGDDVALELGEPMTDETLFKIQNVDAVGNPTSDGLSGVHVLLGADHGYVYPADQYGAVVNVSAPYFNRTGAGLNGAIQQIKQENLHILLRDRGFADGIVEGIALRGGGHFYRDTAPAEITLDDKTVEKLLAAVKPVDLSSLTALLKTNQAEMLAAIANVDDEVLAQLGLKRA